jgi:hypothetical protein
MVKLRRPLGIGHAVKIKITHTPPIYAASTLEVRIHILSI